MTRIAWLNDIHLEFTDESARSAFFATIVSADPDAVLVGVLKANGYFVGIINKVGHSTPYSPWAWDIAEPGKGAPGDLRRLHRQGFPRLPAAPGHGPRAGEVE